MVEKKVGDRSLISGTRDFCTKLYQVSKLRAGDVVMMMMMMMMNRTCGSRGLTSAGKRLPAAIVLVSFGSLALNAKTIEKWTAVTAT